MIIRYIYRTQPRVLFAPTLQQSLPAARYIHASSSMNAADQQGPSDKAKPTTTDEEKPKQTKRKMSAKERDEMMMKRMKERMGQEGDEAWEDGKPVESGLPRHVKNNMFRLI